MSPFATRLMRCNICRRREAEPGRLRCRRCIEAPRKALLPKQQGARDILRERHSAGEFRRSGSVPTERSPEERSPRKRARAESPEPNPTKRRRTFSPERKHSPKRPAANIPLLFIPFEGNYNVGNIGGFEKHGNQTASVFERRSLPPFIERGNQRITTKVDMPSTFGDSDFWSKRQGQVDKKPLMAASKRDFFDVIANQKSSRPPAAEKSSRPPAAEKSSAPSFYEQVVADRLAHLHLGRFSSSEQGLPEIIILSERLLEWPEVLNVHGHVYRRRFVLGERNLQDMAAFVLSSAQCSYRFEVVTRNASYAGKGFTETWLVVRKAVSPAFSIACVHLSSKYTSCKTNNMTEIMAGILEFARRHRIHAILGDCNLNTYGLHGGSFPVSNKFVIEDEEISLQTTFATTNGGSDKAYMGGMICDSGVVFRSTLSTFGNCAIPPWFGRGAFMNQVFSDHHSIYGNYVLFEPGPREDRRYRSREAVGGDCFFEALARGLATDETILALRERIIDGIRAAVTLDPHIVAPRSVLVQVPDTDSAIPVQCASREAFMTEMRLPGRWMEDTLIPYVAQNLNRRIVVEYDGYHARFEPDGSRGDYEGRAPLELAGIRMHCRGNHFW